MDDESKRAADGVVLAVVLGIGLWALIFFVAADIAAWVSGQAPVMVR